MISIQASETGFSGGSLEENVLNSSTLRIRPKFHVGILRNSSHEFSKHSQKCPENRTTPQGTRKSSEISCLEIPFHFRFLPEFQ